MARSGQSSKNNHGNKRLHEDADESSDSDRRIDQDVADALLNQARKKKKKAPAPTQNKNDSDSESHSSADELARLRAEVAALRAERAERTKRGKEQTTEPPTLAGSKLGATIDTRIPIPEKKQKINAKEWQRMLGWTNDKAPWLRCRAYTRRAVNKAPLDLSKPWKNQEAADISQAVALLVKRVPELSRFEKNWGATQLVQETFNHMRGTFIANEISLSDDAPRKRPKKKHPDPEDISNHKEDNNQEDGNQSNEDEGDDDEASNECEETTLASENQKGLGTNTSKKGSAKLLQATFGSKANGVTRPLNAPHQPQDPSPPPATPAAEPRDPPANISMRSTIAAAALAAVNGGVPVRDRSKARPSKQASTKSKPALTNTASKLASMASTKRAGRGGEKNPSDAEDISDNNGNASEDNGDEDAQGTGEENAHGVSDDEDTGPGDNTSKIIGEHGIDASPPKPKSPKLPGRKQLLRKSKTQAKEISSTQFSKGKKRQLEAQDEDGGKQKRGKQGESASTGRNLHSVQTDGKHKRKAIDARKREYGCSPARHVSDSQLEAQPSATDWSGLSESSGTSRFSDGDSEAVVSNEDVDLEEDE
ncbi:hypothetical protein RhiJN_25981 [Ceratobasidium sp. AG-Ba]|nr:hypothetical protein RhiJN_25981 [Ceratobasidium sp. AG-Ba]